MRTSSPLVTFGWGPSFSPQRQSAIVLKKFEQVCRRTSHNTQCLLDDNCWYCRNTSQSKIPVNCYSLNITFDYVWTFTLNFKIWPLDNVLTHPMIVGIKLSAVSSKYYWSWKSYNLHTNFRYMWTMTLNLEIWSWVKVLTHHWVIIINRVKYYSDPTS